MKWLGVRLEVKAEKALHGIEGSIRSVVGDGLVRGLDSES
jgi:hypothetical protein